MAEYRKRPEVILRHRTYMRGYVAKRGEAYRVERNKYFMERHLLVREEKLTRNRERYWKARADLLAVFGGKCKKCGFSDVRALQIDHINGGGTKERKAGGRNGMNLYSKLVREFASNTGETEGKYQILCANCNIIKNVENKECQREYKPRAVH